MPRPFICVLALVLAAAPALGQQSVAPNFIPDDTFEGSTLSAFEVIGDAEWEADNGVITGNAGEGTGMLVFDRGYEDVAIYSGVECLDDCAAGILFRLEETTGGMRGMLLWIDDDMLRLYRVQLENGEVVSSELAHDEGDAHMLTEALESIEIFADRNDIDVYPNGWRGEGPQGQAQDEPETNAPYAFGPIALYIEAGTVRFENVSTKNLLEVAVHPEATSDQFRVQQLNEFPYAWGASVADINGDGSNDVIAGPFYYLGPDFTVRREYYPSQTYNAGEEYVDNMISVAYDWTGDGRVDILATEGRPFVMYVNPGDESRRWERFEVLPEVRSEIAKVADVDGDGEPEVVYVGQDGRVAFGEPNPSDPTAPWRVHKIADSFGEGMHIHGLGVGDVNGDGRTDILQSHGWYEQPASNPGSQEWRHHEILFGFSHDPYGGGGEISVYDVNDDGLNDVVGSMEAHGWGLAWWEQQRDDSGEISFVRHMIMRHFATQNAGNVTFSQVHSGATLADIDRNGVMDFVTGKRHWAHLDTYFDPDPHGEAVVYWYETVRDASAPGGARFVPHLIHNRSGVGSQVTTADIDGDGSIDVVTSGTMGTFIFWNEH